MHRVYNKKDKTWLKDEIYISTMGDMFSSKKSFWNKFGLFKLQLISEHKNIVQNAVGVRDKNGRIVFEGDICKCDVDDDKSILCVVGFAPERASYLFFDYEHSVFYPISNECSDRIEVVGNTFDNPELVEDKGGILEGA